MYIQISDKLGIKILHNYGYSSVRKCEKSYSYKNAIREAKIQRAAFKSGRVAKVFGVRSVKVNGDYFPGIEMEHLPGNTIADLGYNYDQISRIRAMLNRILRKLDIRHGDLHSGNIMKCGRKYYAIDFGQAFLNKGWD